MNKKFTFRLLLICTVLINSLSTQAQILPWLFQFLSNPVLISGTNNAVNSVYRFPSVKTGVDAIVTIQSATGGATVNILDDNNTAKPEAFSPKIHILANTTGTVVFNIKYVLIGTLIPLAQDSLYATAIDIDGGSDIHELDVIDLGGGSANYMTANPEIQITQNGTAFSGLNLAGREYPGIDTTAKQVMFTVKHKNIQSFTYTAGAENTTNSGYNRQKSLYFRDFIYPQGNGTLNVSYLSFDAVVHDKAVLLKWVTSNEINHSHFEVERSFNNQNYTTIATVLDGFTGNGTSKSYQTKDNSTELANRTVAYYRLKQFDINGKVTYSKILAVRLQSSTNVSMQVSPNPFVANVTLRFKATETSAAQINIINAAGQTVLSKQATVGEGFNNLQIDGLDRLSTGMYVVQLKMNGAVIDNKRIIKNQ